MPKPSSKKMPPTLRISLPASWRLEVGGLHLPRTSPRAFPRIPRGRGGRRFALGEHPGPETLANLRHVPWRASSGVRTGPRIRDLQLPASDSSSCPAEFEKSSWQETGSDYLRPMEDENSENPSLWGKESSCTVSLSSGTRSASPHTCVCVCVGGGSPDFLPLLLLPGGVRNTQRRSRPAAVGTHGEQPPSRGGRGLP